MIRLWIERHVRHVVNEKYAIVLDAIDVDVPKSSTFGDFATNVAFGLAKALRRSPQHIAMELSVELNRPEVTVTHVGGFINFAFDRRALAHFIQKYSEDTSVVTENPERILLEYVSANPTGPLHIGHGRWAAIGSALASILRTVGHEVHTEFYVNDAGNQIGLFRNSVECVLQNQPIPEGGYHGDYVRSLALNVAPNQDPVEMMRSEHETVLRSMGTQFDRWYSEKSLHESGAVSRVISELRHRGVVFDSEGAVWFRSTDYGDDKDRVLIKSDGTLTYFAVDVAYHADKLSRGMNRLINIWGADHHGYVPRVNAAVQVLSDPTQPTAFEVIIGQLVTLLKQGEPVRMSKRTGEMVTLQEIIDEIGVDATRFFLLMKSSDSAIDFDLELAQKRSNENPVFYVQYAHARICAIFRKIELSGPIDVSWTDINDAEHAVISWALQYSDELRATAKFKAPHRLVNYLIELARRVHFMYEQSPIMKAEESLQNQRLLILQFAKTILAAGLGVLGISAPSEM